MSIVHVENVWKRYTVPEKRNGRLKDALPHWFGRRSPADQFWALKGVTFDVQAGEALGIIGRNGQGKSTILRLIAGITRPTSGLIATAGRVAALIEVGAGFHQDLTGRDNVYLNGALMGLRKREIKERFDQIVEFAEIERFLDLPVKRYSSGMYMRLGFSIAAHVDPEILLVDEVLAVGDWSFQRKCLDKIAELRSKGRTIIFVSHNMDAVSGLCDRVLLLVGGEVSEIGPPAQIIGHYRDLVAVDTLKSGVNYLGEYARQGSREIEVRAVSLLDDAGRQVDTVATGESLTVRIEYFAHRRVERPVFGVTIRRADRVNCYGTNTGWDGVEAGAVEGNGAVEIRFRDIALLGDTYYLTVGIFDEGTIPFDLLEDVRAFTVRSELMDHGVVNLPHDWKVVPAEGAGQHPSPR